MIRFIFTFTCIFFSTCFSWSQAVYMQDNHIFIHTKQLDRSPASENQELIAKAEVIGLKHTEFGTATKNADEIHWEGVILLDQPAEVGLMFKDIDLSDDAIIYLSYTDDRNNQTLNEKVINEGRLFIEPVFTQEIKVKITSKNNISLELDRLYFMNEDKDIEGNRSFGFGASLDCHPNINCPEGVNYQTYKRGVCKVLMTLEEGIAHCSGSLINNTSGDKTPYVLTAYHCDHGYTPIYSTYRFLFDYEATGCLNPDNEPGYNLVQGAVQVARYQDSDASLFRITGNIPPSYNLYMNGWTTDTSYNERSALMHHPSGDIKKISLENDHPTIHPNSIYWTNGITTSPGAHLHISFDIGAHEKGSSGAALFSESGYILGQLHGGANGCTALRAYIGRFSRSWDTADHPAERLKDWLDPGNTGIHTLPGAEYSDVAQTHTVKVYIRDINERPVNNVRVSKGFPPTFYAPFDGESYNFVVNRGENLDIRISKSTNHGNGITSNDLNLMRSLILNKLPAPTHANLIADINLDDKIDMEDIQELQNMIFNKRNFIFSSGLSWRFDRSLILLNNITQNMNIEVTGFKVGDLDYSADPEQ